MSAREQAAINSDIERRMGKQETITSRIPSRLGVTGGGDVTEEEAEEFIRAISLSALESNFPPPGQQAGDLGIVTGGSTIYEGELFHVNSDKDEWIPYNAWKATTKAGLAGAGQGVEVSHRGQVTEGDEAGRHYVRNAANDAWVSVTHWEE